MINVVDLNNLNLKHLKAPKVPDYYKSEFNNGIKIIGLQNIRSYLKYFYK